jgi:hypothetical protein
MLYRVQLVLAGFELTTLVAIATDYIGSCKSNYHLITAIGAAVYQWCEFKSRRGKNKNLTAQKSNSKEIEKILSRA